MQDPLPQRAGYEPAGAWPLALFFISTAPGRLASSAWHHRSDGPALSLGRLGRFFLPMGRRSRAPGMAWMAPGDAWLVDAPPAPLELPTRPRGIRPARRAPNCPRMKKNSRQRKKTALGSLFRASGPRPSRTGTRACVPVAHSGEAPRATTYLPGHS